MRLFLAVDLPQATRQSISTLQRELRERCAGWRWVRPASIHLTLRFLGEVEEDLDRSTRALWARAASEVLPFAVRVEGLAVFPPRGRPRILCVGARDVGPSDGLATLALSLELAARRAGFAPVAREFHPHLTLARAVRDARPVTPEDRGWDDPQSFDASELTLFRSELLSSGARYTALARFPLGGGSTGTVDAGRAQRGELE